MDILMKTTPETTSVEVLCQCFFLCIYSHPLVIQNCWQTWQVTIPVTPYQLYNARWGLLESRRFDDFFFVEFWMCHKSPCGPEVPSAVKAGCRCFLNRSDSQDKNQSYVVYYAQFIGLERVEKNHDSI